MLLRVDAVCMSLPAEMHYKFAKEALLMNKDVYVEKPITIGKHSLIGAGAVVTKSVEAYSVMVGNPAKRIGTIDEKGNRELKL